MSLKETTRKDGKVWLEGYEDWWNKYLKEEELENNVIAIEKANSKYKYW